jgi:hypothetical protein
MTIDSTCQMIMTLYLYRFVLKLFYLQVFYFSCRIFLHFDVCCRGSISFG